MALIYHSGYVFKDDGTAVEGATVQLYQTDSTTLVTFSDASSTSTTTNSSGYYSASVTEVGATSSYDVKVTSGSSVRYRRGNDKLQLEELDIRNDTGATQGGLFVANTTNSTANKVATFAGMNSTRADGDEIYISFELANSAGEIEEFARITAEAVDVTNGQEDGQLRFGVAKTDGTVTDVFTINSTTGGATSMTFDVSDDITLDADGGDIFFKDGGTTFGSATNNSGNLIIKSGTTTALTFTGSNVAIAGDLTITGDDLVMGTNTSGHILVADGTNYNPVAVSGDITMASNGAVTIAGTSVETGMIAADAITGAKIADDAIGSEHIADDAVVSAAIADDAITSALIADDAITTALIADDAITSALIADDAITTALIADDAITSALIADGAVTTALIGADAVTGAKIADDAIDSEHYTDGSIDNAHLADDAVDSDELAAGAVDTAHIADNQVTLAKMAGLARGKIIYGDASGDPAALAVGSANYVLTSDGTDISWAAATTGDITGVTAGNGLSGGGTSGGVTLALDLSELTDTAIANGDYIVFTDTTDSNATVKGDLADVATLFAGTGLTASSSVIGVDASQTQITSVGTIGTGVWQGTVVAAAYLPDASTSAQGVSELATSAEVTTGTDTGRTVTPDALAGSVVFGTRYVQCVVFDFATDIAEGNGKFYFHIPAGLNGMDLVEVHSEVITAGNGSTIDVQIHNATDGSDMLSTSLTIDNTETGSDTAATAAVIDTGEDDVATNDLIRIDVDGNGGDTTIAKGLIVTLGFRLP